MALDVEDGAEVDDERLRIRLLGGRGITPLFEELGRSHVGASVTERGFVRKAGACWSFAGAIGFGVQLRVARLRSFTILRRSRMTIVGQRGPLAASQRIPNREEIRKDYPRLDDEDIRHVLFYAAASIDDHIDDVTD